MRAMSRRSKTLKALLRLVDLFEAGLQFRYLLSVDSKLMTAVEAMHVVYVFEPANGLPEHCAALGVWALERHLFFVGHK